MGADLQGTMHAQLDSSQSGLQCSPSVTSLAPGSPLGQAWALRNTFPHTERCPFFTLCTLPSPFTHFPINWPFDPEPIEPLGHERPKGAVFMNTDHGRSRRSVR